MDGQVGFGGADAVGELGEWWLFGVKLTGGGVEVGCGRGRG